MQIDTMHRGEFFSAMKSSSVLILATTVSIRYHIFSIEGNDYDEDSDRIEL